jgi:hypothetical protein
MSDQAPRRGDKFRSLQAARNNSPVPPSQQVQTAKRDKFASMAARQESQTADASAGPPSAQQTPPAAPVPAQSPPKRDKFASMAARQQNSSEASAPAVAAAAPKRDKFASMAQATAKPPTKDKFASMAQTATQKNKRDKFASLAQQQSKPPEAKTEDTKRTTEERMAELKKRIQQRQTVLKDLEKAEGYTWNLIQLSSKTAKQLTKLTVDETSESLSGVCSSYRSTLQQIHSLISPHANFVKSYQNFDRSHQEASEATSNMYAARVESRLAQERRNVLEELLRLEEREAPLDSMTEDNKRKRDD